MEKSDQKNGIHAADRELAAQGMDGGACGVDHLGRTRAAGLEDVRPGDIGVSAGTQAELERLMDSIVSP